MVRSACVLFFLFIVSYVLAAQTNTALADLALRHTILITAGVSAASPAGTGDVN